ncbi:MAG: DUF502 domain-containing protein [Candidatus Wallbacteria bacterium]|nr:DUF502 domain-containing protein [Candidatus Wallbacteria bacterium]
MKRNNIAGFKSYLWAFESKASHWFKQLKTLFFSGLFFLLPFAVTIFVLIYFFRIADGLMGPPLKKLIGYSIPGLGILTTVIFVIMVGAVARKAGEGLFNFIAAFFMKLPLASWLITTTKEISDFLRKKDQMLFRNTVLVEYPRRGSYALGFEIVDAPDELKEKTGEDLVSVFIPTTPNPTSGLLLFLPKKEVIAIDLKVEIAMKMVISGGIIAADKNFLDAR